MNMSFYFPNVFRLKATTGSHTSLTHIVYNLLNYIFKSVTSLQMINNLLQHTTFKSQKDNINESYMISKNFERNRTGDDFYSLFRYRYLTKRHNDHNYEIINI